MAATKLQLITAMYEYNIKSVTNTAADWQRFLRSASRNYKLPFDEQILVHAQRPDAIAVLELDKWNKHFGRWVNKGATGIAVVDRNHPGKRKLKYYFDVSDTHESKFTRPVPIWSMKQEYVPYVIETLESTFGELSEKESLAQAIMSAAKNAVDDNITDYLSQLQYSLKGSILDSLSNDEIENITHGLMYNSVAYMMLHRCGIDPEFFIDNDDFNNLYHFSTPETVTILGTATGDIAEMGLREISSTVLNLQKNKIRTFANNDRNDYNKNTINNERGFEHGRTDLQQRERVHDSRPNPAGRTRSSAWQIRPNAPQIPQEQPQGAVRQSADERQAEPAPIGNPADSRPTHGTDGVADGGGTGRDGGTESQRHDEVGGHDEQHSTLGGGINQSGTDLQLEDFPTPEQQQNNIEQAEGRKPFAISMDGAFPQELIDEELCRSSNFHYGKFRIYQQFEKSLSDKENADFLKNEYGIGGHHPAYGIGLSQTHDNKGLQLVYTDENKQKIQTFLNWNQVAKRISELIKADRYLNEKEKNELYPQYLNYLEEQAVQRQKIDFIESMGNVPPAMKRDTTSLRIADFINALPRYLLNKLDEHGFSDLTDTVSVSQIDEILLNPQKTSQLAVAMQAVGGASCDSFGRQGYYFNQELNELHPRQLTYHLGDTVYIGSDEYEVISFDDTIVQLFDTKYPLINKEFPRDEFDRKVAENPLNEHLWSVATEIQPEQSKSQQDPFHNPILKEQIHNTLSELGFVVEDEIIDNGIMEYRARGGRSVSADDIADYIEDELLTDDENLEHELGTEGIEEPIQESTPEPYAPKPGENYEIQGRLFVVDSVNEEFGDISLRDITFQENAGFPIFRKESLDFIHMYDPINIFRAVAEHETDPILELNHEIREIGKSRYIVVLPEERERTDPPLADNQEIKEIDGVEFVFTNVTPEESEPHPETTITPAWEQKKKPARVNYFDAFPNVPMSERHNFKITDDNLGHGGAKAKFRANMEAINLLHELEFDGKLATPEQQETLSRYVGWGSLAQAFDPNNTSWANEHLELQTALSPEEYESARATTLNAHYTCPAVIKAIYKAVENMGFKTGNILDPGCGVGNFQGLLPDSMADSKMYGIELDPITGRICQQLYQKNSIAIQGYENTALPDSFFDLAVGNVPFGGYGVRDKQYDKYKFNIHDYFFAKTLDKIRPGGVVAFVTSSWTMDKQNPAVRKYIAQRAELLGAIRLPNNAFLANAGTQVTTDIIFLQKRDRIVDLEPDWVHLGQNEDGFAINQYFIDNPEMLLGTMSNEDGTRMYGNMNSTTCVPFPDSDLADLLDEAVQNIHAEITEYEIGDDEQEIDDSIPADPSVRNFSYAVVDDKVYFRENSRMRPCELSATAESRIKGMIEIRDCVRNLIEYQTEDYSEGDIKAEQSKLNRLYDNFTKKYGLISSRANVSAFGSDNSYPLLGALEILDEDGNLKRKADMFTKRTIRPRVDITHVDTASEALAVSLGEQAKVDLDFMSQLTGKTAVELVNELEGVIFYDFGNPKRTVSAFNPETMDLHDKFPLVTADEYLSGNVRDKLYHMKVFDDTVGGNFHGVNTSVNVKALEAVQPKDLTAAEISVRLGATWLPVPVVQQFVYELLETPYHIQHYIKVNYSKHTAEWGIENKNADRSNVKVHSAYGTGRANAYKIIEETLNLRDIRVFDYVEDDSGNKKPVLNKKETMIAQAKQEQIKAAFQDWVWKDPERREELCQIYNEKFNSIRPREYDGSHIKFIGMNPEIQLREHQINAVARIIYGGNTLLAHEVGAGKTFEMVAAAMEMKRLGLCTKSMIVVPNHIIEQFAAEWLQLYPSANILVSTKKDFEPKNRRKFCARIATSDIDAVIIGHSQFEKIPMSIEFQCEMLEEQLNDLLAGIAEAKRNKGSNFTVKQLEKCRKALQLKLDKLNDQSRKDDFMDFEELGINRLFVDESHGYKNLYLYTKMRNVGGIAQNEAQKSSDMFMKTRYLDKETDGRGVIFATGTPISNSMVELYSIQRYLQYDSLCQSGLQHFDEWASTFGETVTAIELSPEGVNC